MPYRNRKLLDVRDYPCQRCGAKDGTVVAAHYQGIGAHLLGKGRGQKVADYATVPLCATCHKQFDEYEDGNKAEVSLMFALLILQSLDKRVFKK